MGEWTRVRLGDLIEVYNSQRRPIKSTDRVSGETPYYGASGVVDSVDGYTHEGEFLLIAEDGENLRSRSTPIAFRADGKIWVNNHAHVVTGKYSFDTRFLEHALALSDISGYLTGSAQPKLSRAAMESIALTVPLPSTRKAIAEVLGALDDKIVANGRVSRRAAELAASSFGESFSTTLENANSLAELFAKGQLEYGDGYRTKKSELAMSGFRIIRAADVKDSVVRLSGSDFVSAAFSRQMGRKVALPRDIVLTTKGTVGRIAIVPESVGNAVYSPQCCYFRLPEASALDYGYLVGWSLSDDIQRQLALVMHKSDMAPYVNLKDIGSLSIPVPDEATQRRIGAEQRALIELQHACSAENEALAHTRDQLLPLLMSGKVTVKEAEEEVGGLV
ncbi:restriction endonuclease subunit S [Gordonia polyisoprenivorans]|uniref:restriction endonuclease subunit S n=1 Tax=Gordonia polyisoprenivorans TaxID=84595 RepID=UPI001AD7D8F5|nr:restriction endonuclease subunit S [Gordonia polyisoprenivorans]QTI69620.1 restriction endonuclease subunit S [Gordonia polyisoprenivorans]